MKFKNVRTQKELREVIANRETPICLGSETFIAPAGEQIFAGDSAHIKAGYSAIVSAWDSARVEAYNTAHVRAWGSAFVSAWDSAQIWAGDSARVDAWGMVHVVAENSAHVKASKYVSVTRLPVTFGTGPEVKGGVLIQVPAIITPQDFCDYYGVPKGPTKDSVILFKCVNNAWRSNHGAYYEPGSFVRAYDWNPEPHCGGGLHFCGRPIHTRDYSNSTRFVACEVNLKDTVVISDSIKQVDKIKAKWCLVLYECDIDGKKIPADMTHAEP